MISELTVTQLKMLNMAIGLIEQLMNERKDNYVGGYFDQIDRNGDKWMYKISITKHKKQK